MPDKIGARGTGPGRGERLPVAPKAPRSELVIIPTYKRNAFLHCCLDRIRKQDAQIPIMVFSDRGESNLELRSIVRKFNAGLIVMPRHDLYGNSFVVLEALRWAHMTGAELIHYFEDDVAAHPDCLSWHRKQHDLFDDIFASCGWVFNLFAPISDDLMFAPWFYSPNFCIRKERLAQVVEHANPRYYNDMRGYVLRTFPDSILHNAGRQLNTNYMEQDAVFQFCLMKDGSQVVWNGIAKVDHVGWVGYNRPNGTPLTGPLDHCVKQVEGFIADKYARMAAFGRAIVEREIGSSIPKREIKYRISLPGEWQTEVTSEFEFKDLPEKINSARIPREARIEIISRNV